MFDIISDIFKFILANGALADHIYVGVTKDQDGTKERHHLTNEIPQIWREAESYAEAHYIESYFIRKIGTRGHEGGGDEESRWVYAYLRGVDTDP